MNTSEPTGFVFDERFAEAFFHGIAHRNPKNADWSIHRVMGRRLRPYSLWHRLQLEYAGGPLATGGLATMTDLEDAVAVCRSVFPYHARPLRWRRTMRIGRSLERETELFRQYVNDFNTVPILEPIDTSGRTEIREPDMDAILIEVASYQRHTGCAHEVPWNLPMAQVYWMNATFSRAEGAQFEVLTPLVEARKKRLRAKKDELDRQRIEEMVAKEGLTAEAAAAKLAELHRVARARQEKFNQAKKRRRR